MRVEAGQGLRPGTAVAAVLACISAVCGCGSAAVNDPVGPLHELPFAQSGQRLKVWSFVGSGVELFSTFHDNRLDADCEFVPNPAGDRYVCLPKAIADLVYLDAACSQPATRSGPRVTLARDQWVSGVVPGTAETCVGAPPPQRVGYRVGERLFAGGIDALDQPLPSVFSGTSSDCRPTGLQDALLPPDLLRLERQDDSVFVSGTHATRPAADGFVVERVVAEDGAELTVGIRGRNGEPCLVQADGRCVPGPVGAVPVNGVGDYLDADCTEPAFSQAVGSLCDEPKLGVKTVAGQVHVYELEKTSVVFAKTELLDPATGASVFDSAGELQFSCKPDAGVAAYAAKNEVTSNFAMAGSLEATFGAFRLVQHISPSVGAPAPPIIAFEAGGVFVDEQGQGCKTRTTARNELECDPPGPEVYQVGLTKDAACQIGLYDFLGPHGDPTHIPDISSLRDVDPVDGVPRTWLSFKPYTGPRYTGSAGSCSPVDSTSLLLEVDRAAALPELTLFER